MKSPELVSASSGQVVGSSLRDLPATTRGPRSGTTYLLDTCTFIWLLTGSDELSKLALEVGSDRESEIFVSVVSIWELLVKHTLGKLPLPNPPEQKLKEAIAEMGFVPLELSLEAVFQLPKLPPVHRDPFDRLLICQSIAGGFTLLTPDPEIRRYPVLTAW